ncbi:MAG: hypothetical protein QF921_04305 [Pseudomonadales bacterium]|jgi:hypothetical protein|nr:hypothetical protein [Pseudomonadales bacterium]MDP6825753.1 hypothetical protein [Pseudomonadales bacterium]MDP6970724.1 hypothetical protein [Pseudomonadales bacterium]
MPLSMHAFVVVRGLALLTPVLRAEVARGPSLSPNAGTGKDARDAARAWKLQSASDKTFKVSGGLRSPAQHAFGDILREEGAHIRGP